MDIKFSKNDAVAFTPRVATGNSAGADLTAAKLVKNSLFKVWYNTNISVEIPQGHVGLIFQRSSISSNVDLTLANSIGVIDSDFRGNIQVRFNRTFKGIFTRKRYKLGERMAQLIIVKIPKVKYLEVNKLNNTKRGNGGFGSTGSKAKR